MIDTPNTTEPWRAAAYEGEFCSMCGMKAVAKVGEEINSDDPHQHRHNRTAFICANHFFDLMGQWP